MYMKRKERYLVTFLYLEEATYKYMRTPISYLPLKT